MGISYERVINNEAINHHVKSICILIFRGTDRSDSTKLELDLAYITLTLFLKSSFYNELTNIICVMELNF